VLGVIAYHAFPGQLPGGFSGVDVFFVISGFLITQLLLRDLDAGSFSIAAFYARRIRRIFPSLLLVLSTVWALGWFLLLADEYQGLGKHVAGGAAFASNFVLWDEVGYFDAAAEAKPLLHLWSLGIEEQFYLAWPLALAIAWRIRRSTLVVTLVILAASFAVHVLASHDGAITRAFYGPHARLWELLFGGAIAQLATTGRAAVRDGASLVGAAAIVGGLVLVTRGPGVSAVWALLPVGGAALVIWAGDGAWFNRVILARTALRWIGLISYPLYLWHWPLLALLRILEGESPPPSHRLVAIAASVALAAAAYRWIECPIRRGDRRRVVVLALCAGMLVVGTVGFYTYEHDGLPMRAIQRAAPRFPGFGFASSPGCRVARPHAGKCFASEVTYPESVLVLGDSHAEALAPAFIAASSSGALGMNLLLISRPGCMPFAHTQSFDAAGKPTFHCREAVGAALTEAVTDPKITTVVLIARHAFRATWRGFGDEPDLAGPIGHSAFDDGHRRSEAAAEVYRLGLEATLAQLATRPLRILFVDQAPELGFDPRACSPRPFGLGRSGEAQCGLARRAVDARQQTYRAIVDDVLARNPRIVRVDPLPLFCDANRCSAWRGGMMMYHNDDHLSRAGGAVVVDAVLARLRD